MLFYYSVLSFLILFIEKLRRYFKAYGPVQDAVVMKDPVSKRSRGFGFITYFDVASVENALANEPHTIDMRRVEAKRAVPRSEINRDSFNGSNQNQTTNSLPNYYSNLSSSSGEDNSFNSMGLSLQNNNSNQPLPVNRSPIVKSWKGLVQNQNQNENYSFNNTVSPSYEKLPNNSNNTSNSPNSNISSNLDNSKNGFNVNLPPFQASSDEYAYNKIFVGGLHYDTRDPDFRQYFEKYGKVISAEVMFNRETHKSRGFGFIIFENEESAIRVCNEKIHYIADKQVEVKRAIPRSKIGSINNPNTTSYSNTLNNSSNTSTQSTESVSSSSPSSSSPSSPHTGPINMTVSPSTNVRNDVRRSMSVNSIGMGSLSGNSSTLAASTSLKLPGTQTQQPNPSRKIPTFLPSSASPSEVTSTPSPSENNGETKPVSYVAILKSNPPTTSPVSSPSLSSIPLDDYSSLFLKDMNDNNIPSFSLTSAVRSSSENLHIPAPPTPLAMNSLPSSTPSISSFLSSESLSSNNSSLLNNDNWYSSMYDNNFFFSNSLNKDEDNNNHRPSRAQSEPVIQIQKGWENDLGFLSSNTAFEGFPHLSASGSSSSLNNMTEDRRDQGNLLGDSLNWLRNPGDVFPSNSSISGSSIHSSPLSVSGNEHGSLGGLSLPPSIMNTNSNSSSSGQSPLVPSFESWHNIVSGTSNPSENFDPSISRIFQEINLNSSLSSIDESGSKILSITRNSRANSELSSNSDISRESNTNGLLNFGFSGFNGLVTGNSNNVNGSISSNSSTLGNSNNELRFDSKEFDPNSSKLWTPSSDFRFNQ